MSKSINYLFRQLTAFFLVAVFSGNFVVSAQTRKSNSGQTAANQSKQTAPKCSGAWTGSITYTRMQSMIEDKTTPRVSNRGEDKRNWQMKYEYKADVGVIEAPEKTAQTSAKRQSRINFLQPKKSPPLKKIRVTAVKRGKK